MASPSASRLSPSDGQAAGTFFLGVDVGGTNLRCALVAAHAPTDVLARADAPTPPGSAAVIDRAVDLMARCLRAAGVAWDGVAGIGCVTPGILDATAGVVHTATNLGWEDVPLRALLAERTGRPVVIENDVNAGAMAEYRFGEAMPPHSLVYLTVSTGIACGAVIEQRVLRGFGNAAGEVGFLAVDLAALDDRARSLEGLAGGASLARAWKTARAAQANGQASAHSGSAHSGSAHPDRAEPTAADVFDAARAGRPEAARLVAEATESVTLAVAAITCVLNPEVLVLGGSIAEHEPSVVARVRAHLAAALPFAPRVELARLGGDAPLLGAVALAEQHAALLA